MRRAARALFGPARRAAPRLAVGPSVAQRTVYVALALATVAAAALRLPFLSHQSLWFDEVFTRAVISRSTLTGVWHQLEATESTPPLYYVIVWVTGGRSAAAMRLPSALASIVAVPLAYLALRRLVGQRPALAASAILAVSPILVSYATDARAYSLLVLTGVLSVWGFSAALEHPTRRRYAGWGAASVACLWTHYFGAFLVAAEAVVLLALRPAARRITLGSTALIAVCAAPLIPLLARQTGDERAAFIAGISLRSRLLTTARQFAMGPNVPRTWLEAAGLAIACAGIAVGLGLAVRSGPATRALLALAALVLLVPLILAIAGVEDRFYVRNMVALVPLAAALAAPALLGLGAAPLALYLALAALASVWVATDWRYEQPDWRGAVHRTQAIDPGAAFIAVGQYSGVVARVYLGRRPVSQTSSQEAWVAVPPIRASGHRGLGPAATAPGAPAGLPGFVPIRVTIFHGFRLELLQASRPQPIARLPGATIFAPG